MARKITIVTPENVRIEYELAGLASRGGAAIIDSLLQGLLLAVIMAVRIPLTVYNKWPGTSWANALLVIAGFILWYGYYVYFESTWNGQTPGKRYARMRTVREGGMPVDFASAAIRNLVRVVDMLPFAYLIGMLSILFSGRNKRLGDYAAGTLVVKERGEWMPDISDHKQQPQPNTESPEADLVRNIELVTSDDFEAVKRFVERKAELQDSVREQLAAKMAAPLMAKLGIDDDNNISYSNLLTEIYNKCTLTRGMR